MNTVVNAILDVPTLEIVIEGLPLAALVIDPEDYVLALNRRALIDFAIGPRPGAGVRFRDLPVSYRVPRLHAAVEAVKSHGMPVWLPEVGITRESGATPMTILVAPLRAADARLRGILVSAQSREEIAGLRRAHRVSVAQIIAGTADRGMRLASDNEALRATIATLQAVNEDLQVREEELVASCELLQATNEGLQAQVAALEAAIPRSGTRQ
jgi:hypothetical protein